MKTYSVTHPGLVKAENQDRFLIKEFYDGSVFLAVADGMGGQNGGERAAQIAIESLVDFDPSSKSLEAHLAELMKAANQQIFEVAKKDPQLKGMGTTLTVAVVRKEMIHWAHVGDSRLYKFNGDELFQVTEDDTMAGFLLAEGEINKEEARVHSMRSALFQCIGCGYFEAETGTFALKERNLLLLSTDGLHDEVPEEIIISILGSHDRLKGKLEALLSAALETGGRDNITVVGAEI